MKKINMREFDKSKWLEAIPDVVLITEASGLIRYANHACENLLGWKPDELRGMSVEQLIPERFNKHASLRKEFMNTPTKRSMGMGMELAALHRSGEEISVDISLYPLILDGAPHVVVTIRDMRIYGEKSQRLRLLSVAVDAAASGVVITDRIGIIIWVNPAVCRMTGYNADELIGYRPSLLKSGHHDAKFYADLWGKVTKGETWKGAIINRRKDGSEYYEDQTIAPVRDNKENITHFIAIKQDVTERVRAEKKLKETRDQLQQRVIEVETLEAKLREQVIRDPLTNLFNRRYLNETLPRELANASRHGTCVALMIIDIDHFKSINDRYGHLAGDNVLVELSKFLINQSRRGDVACRFGGEEFVVLMVSATLEDGMQRAELWRQSFEAATIESDKGMIYTTFSAGVAEWIPGETAAELITRADEALYQAKDAGRNRVHAANSED